MSYGSQNVYNNQNFKRLRKRCHNLIIDSTYFNNNRILQKSQEKNRTSTEKMTGSSLKYIQAHLEQFWCERKDDKVLKNMDIDEYLNQKGIQNALLKLLTIKCKRYPYKNKKIHIRIQFTDQYPNVPPKMYVLPHHNHHFLHANVYQDNGEVCHPALELKEYQKFNFKFTTILKKIYELLFKPNFKNPANLVLGNLFKENQREYQKVIDQNAKQLQDADQSQSESEEVNEISK